MRKILLFLVVIFTLILPNAFAQLTCEGEGQAFFIPEYLQKSSISIPCSLSVSSAPLNASCLAFIEYEGDLISTFPEIVEIDLVGRESFIELASSGTSTSFTVNFKNRDLLHLVNFSWTVWCNADAFYSSEGSFITEYPFAETSFEKFQTIFIRDSTQVIVIFLTAIIAFLAALFVIKVL